MQQNSFMQGQLGDFFTDEEMCTNSKVIQKNTSNNRTEIVAKISKAMLFVICLQACKLVFLALSTHANTAASAFMYDFWLYHFLNFCSHCLLFIQVLKQINKGCFIKARRILVFGFCSYLFWACMLWRGDVGLQYYFVLAIFICSYLFSGQEIRSFIAISVLMALSFLYFSFAHPHYLGQELLSITPHTLTIAQNKKINSIGFILSCGICVYFIRQILSRHWHQLKMLQHNQQQLLKKIFPSELAEQLVDINDNTLYFSRVLGVIFIDICDFSEMLNTTKQDPNSWQQFYSIYDQFDTCLSDLDARRIKVNGDQYIAIIGLNLNSSDIKITNQTIKACFALQKSSPLPIKIGASFGEVSLGIFDINHPNFDIWGQTVIRAARLEQAAKGNEIMVDEAIHTHNTLLDASSFQQETALKGLGKQTTFEISHFIS